MCLPQLKGLLSVVSAWMSLAAWIGLRLVSVLAGRKLSQYFNNNNAGDGSGCQSFNNNNGRKMLQAFNNNNAGGGSGCQYFNNNNGANGAFW